MTWTITVSNKGLANATAVKLADTLTATAGLSAINASPSQGTCTVLANSINCNLGSLANSGTATVKISAVTINSGTIANMAAVSADQPDNQSANNSSTSSLTVQTLLCNGVKPNIVGTPGNDTVKGTTNRDVIHALSGNDIITGADSDDIICGGEGQDTINAGKGNDKIDGGGGTDSCDGATGNDSAVNCEVVSNVP